MTETVSPCRPRAVRTDRGTYGPRNRRIVRTPCNLGNWRAWFICSVVGHGRRVAILYGGGIFACRHCSPTSVSG